MSERNDFSEGKKEACEHCGAPTVRFMAFDGTHYCVAVSNKAIFDYLGNKNDIDDFILDRLMRAERIIVDLRKQIKDMDRKRGKGCG